MRTDCRKQDTTWIAFHGRTVVWPAESVASRPLWHDQPSAARPALRRATMSIWSTADRLLNGRPRFGHRSTVVPPQTYIGEHHAKNRPLPLVFEGGRRGRSVLRVDLSGFTRHARH